MSYSKKDFARELIAELDREYDVVRLARWAMHSYYQHSHELEDDVQNEIMAVVVMEEGPEFEMTEEELREFAGRLMS